MTDKPITKSDVQYLLNNIYDDINALRSTVLDSDTINRLVTLADTAVTKDDVVTSTQNGVCTPEMLNKINSMAVFPFKHVQCISIYLTSGTTEVNIDNEFTKSLSSLFVLVNGLTEIKSSTEKNINMLYVESTSQAVFNYNFTLVGPRKLKIRAHSNMPYISMLIAEV